MVKIHGKYNRPGSFDFIPGATYVGDSRVIGLAVFVDQTDPSQILLRFNEQQPRRVNYKEFLRTVKLTHCVCRYFDCLILFDYKSIKHSNFMKAKRVAIY